MNMPHFETKQLPAQPDLLAPDTSEIRLLLQTAGGSLCHCTLPVGATSKAVQHKTVDEIWYFLSGQGQMWRKLDQKEEIVEVHAGTSLTIPVGTTFQFHNKGSEPLSFLCLTMPPWPGPDEALLVEGVYGL
jgi:mannose-6-phosphate isomerase-like protein (cupin superfamily)